MFARVSSISAYDPLETWLLPKYEMLCMIRFQENWGSPGLGGLRTAGLYSLAGLLDYEDTRLKTSSRVRVGLYLAWKAS